MDLHPFHERKPKTFILTMKFRFSTVCLFLIGLVAASCNKLASTSEPVYYSEPQEIVLQVGDGFEAVVETKAEALTAVPTSLFWGASTGTSTETVKWATASKDVSGSSSKIINTGKYQTATPTAYNYYVANQTFTVAGAMTVANNNTDIVAGRTAQNSTTSPAVTLNHIFARTGSLTCNAQSGYTISAVSWKIVGKSEINGTAGTYNMKSQTWTAASTKLTSDTDIDSDSDMYLIPGTYTLKVTYTLAKGDYHETFTKSCDVTIVGGKVNNVTCTAIGGDASEIKISVTLTAWGTQNHTPSLS